MAFFKKKQQSSHAGMPPPRIHKGLTFYPKAIYNTKKKAKQYLKKSKEANDNYYRIWKHKHHGYTVYVSNKKKYRHGGIRHRSKTGEGPYSKY